MKAGDVVTVESESALSPRPTVTSRSGSGKVRPTRSGGPSTTSSQTTGRALDPSTASEPSPRRRPASSRATAPGRSVAKAIVGGSSPGPAPGARRRRGGGEDGHPLGTWADVVGGSGGRWHDGRGVLACLGLGRRRRRGGTCVFSMSGTSSRAGSPPGTAGTRVTWGAAASSSAAGGGTGTWTGASAARRRGHPPRRPSPASRPRPPPPAAPRQAVGRPAVRAAVRRPQELGSLPVRGRLPERLARRRAPPVQARSGSGMAPGGW